MSFFSPGGLGAECAGSGAAELVAQPVVRSEAAQRLSAGSSEKGNFNWCDISASCASLLIVHDEQMRFVQTFPDEPRP